VSTGIIVTAEVTEYKGFNGLHDIEVGSILSPVQDEPRLRIGERLKAYRTAHADHKGKPMPQTELARMMRLQQSRISDWERGRYGMVDLRSLVRVAVALGEPIDVLIQGWDDRYDAMVDDLARQRPLKVSGHQKGGGHGTESAEARALEQRVSQLEHELKMSKDVIQRLQAILNSAADETRIPPPNAAGRRRRR
jgi:transcriptional regulator with XRE-family HTH domain